MSSISGDSLPLGEVRWTGNSVLRKEDRRFLLGRGRFTDDVPSERALHLSFTRSPIAAGTIDSIDLSATLASAGVRGAFTAADLGNPGLEALMDRVEFVRTTMPLLAVDRVRFVGEPVVAVVADDAYAAEDGADLADVRVTETQSVMSAGAALAGAGPVHDQAPDGILIDLKMFPDPELDSVIEGSALLIEKTFSGSRLNASPMEGRVCLAEWDDRDEQLVVHVSTQVPHQVRSGLAAVTGLPERSIRVIASDVGGGFGLKCVVGREELIAAMIAMRLHRPVRWVEDRREGLTASFHGHEVTCHVRAGFDAEGRIQGLSADVVCDVGAYSAYPFTCGVEPLMAASEVPGVYKVPHFSSRGRAVSTNKAPTAPYRGVSRPQIVIVMERLMESAARRLGLDPVEVRLRNLIQPDEFPYTGPNGVTYEKGSYRESLELCTQAIEHAGWKSGPTTVPAPITGSPREVLRGIGIACFSERSAYGTETMGQRSMHMTPGYDVVHISMDPSGEVTVTAGTCGHGQGHETTFAQIVADQLSINPDQVKVREGDTDLSSYGWGTWGSRSLVIGGGAAHLAAGKLADRIKRVAADLMEVDVADVELTNGRVRVRGAADVGMSLKEIAETAYWQAQRIHSDDEYLLEARASFDPPGTFSNSTHAALVEIDPGTGDVHVIDYIVVEDCGVMVNPMIVTGQVAGGVTQGIAAALYERLTFDSNGQPLSGSYIDYLVPTAAEIPRLKMQHLETPSANSVTGSKGMGEGGAIGAPAAVLNAVNDALKQCSVEFDSVPVTPDLVLQALAAVESADASAA
ncbi:MAG: xanthine dehydrogenase family protein molybdopterin-binding subunit [Nakamurella sp.]